MTNAKQPKPGFHNLFLFDVDSVLVEALGYLRALQDTVAHFSQWMGVGKHPPTEAEIRAGEAYGLTSEWDSAPTYIITLLIERLRLNPIQHRDPALVRSSRWSNILDTLGRSPLLLPHPNYTAIAAQIGARLRQDGGATATAARIVLGEIAQSLPPSSRAMIINLLDDLLGHTHDFQLAPITQYFQHLAIGNERIAETYGTAPIFTSPSYLSEYDIPLLDPQIRDRLLKQIQEGELGATLYTARPSYPPMDADIHDTTTSKIGYSPEGELARSLVGLDKLPLIGLGHVGWLGLRVGVDVATLVKPSPVQALAAIGAAASGQEATSLEAAWALYAERRLTPPLTDLGRTAIHVFEDSTGGLRAVRHAVALLNAAGIPVTYHPYGITPATGTKKEAMTKEGVQVYHSVNIAVQEAFNRL
ncbi:MAG: hypothetical protein JXA33_13275 [Anaerolineae bacterium]|nr:hypothetical protein [Anaerolineae bacterium]